MTDSGNAVSTHRISVGMLALAIFLAAPPLTQAGTPQQKKSKQGTKPASQSETDSKRAALHQALPEPLTSFGAAVLGDYLYVFSGHDGDAHGEGRDLLADHFRRIKVDDPEANWEELAKHHPAQSTALVTDGKYLYRIGGLSFLNSSGEETNFNSTQFFSRYDVEEDKWTELAPLPEPRSSLDAAVLGRSIYVAGGWNLQGKSSRDAPWHEDILRFDLDHSEAGWQTMKGPGYNTRAISLAAYDGKIYLLGGIGERGISRKVSVYDPQTDSWSDGPELKADSSTAGFATSSFATGGHLYYTGGSGIVYRLNADQTDWEVADRLLFPRMFLRLLPLSEQRLIALGGTSMNAGRIGIVESLRVDSGKNKFSKQVSWSVKYDGQAKQSQMLVLNGLKLYAFGGNNSRAPHNFTKETLVDEAFVFDIARQTVEKLPSLPQAVQSGSAVSLSQTSEHESIFVTGGMGFEGNEFASLKEIFRFDPESQSWSKSPVQLPEPRSMFHAATYENAIWCFGGSIVGKDRELLKTVVHWWGDDSKPAPLPDVSLPTPRRSFGGAVLNDQYYLVGGLTNSSRIAETVDVFDFKERTWKTTAAPKTPRVFPSLVAAGDKLYLFGGFTNVDGHFSPAGSLEMYDPQADEWTVVAAELAGVDPSMSMFAMNGRLLFYGIDKTEDGLARFVLLDPAPETPPEQVASMSFGSRRRDPAQQAKQEAMSLMRKDTDKDGKLSSAELGERMADFVKKADQNGDGFVTVEEAAAVIENENRSEASENRQGRPGQPSRDKSNKPDEKKQDEKRPAEKKTKQEAADKKKP
ncbi:N-acetylneuraminate epimerase [Gimesia maris]|nr:N-acetylneuraminate epimerase [Gimesia maris]